MILFPAIDLYDGKSVRLYKGDYQNMTVYSEEPIAVAKDFVRKGATHIHMVDLEGAKDGTTPNLSIVAGVARETNLFIEVGGGVRNMETVEKYLDIGVSRVILGTAAVTDEAFLRCAAAAYPGKIAVSADIRDGKIAIKGWMETSDMTLDTFLETMEAIGIRNVICTDISRDGAMRGTNLELYRTLSGKYHMDITASGGVSTMDDIEQLRNMGLYGAIIGKAYYTGAIDLEKALEAAR